jgi:predicted naringenin-chalcone synthase
MTWITADFGMKMTLSRQVPEKITANVRGFVTDLCRVSNLDMGILSEVVGAIHPGGPRIIDAVSRDLELNETQVAESRYVLRNYGNMSSATLPHIWKEVLDRRERGTKVLSLAFGPGLTMFGTMFEII